VCGLIIDRDYNASKNIRKIGLIKVGLVQPATLGMHGIYPYMQMSVVESGSSDALAEG
jgi:transposase